jgi:hypothetical protein
MTELRKCPFCGGKAEMYNYCLNEWYIGCGECSCDLGVFDTKAKAIEAWNKRVGDANKTIENVVTCGECKYFERVSPDNINGYCTSEEVASDEEGGASFSCWRTDDDYCSFGWKREVKE